MPMTACEHVNSVIPARHRVRVQTEVTMLETATYTCLYLSGSSRSRRLRLLQPPFVHRVHFYAALDALANVAAFCLVCLYPRLPLHGTRADF